MTLIILTFSSSSKTQAAWFDDNWAYRVAIPVTDTVTETQKYGTTGNIVTTDSSKFQSDCGDVRFVDSTGKLLKYTLASACNSATTTFSVNMDTILTSQTIYMYYGNPSAPDGFLSTNPYSVCASCTVGSPATEEKASSPIGYWKLDGVQGTTVLDSTTLKNNGTLSGATVKTTDQCISDKCLYFNGSSDNIKIPSNTNYNFTVSGGFSGFLWIKKTGYCDNASGNEVFMSRVGTLQDQQTWWIGCLGSGSGADYNKVVIYMMDSSRNIDNLISPSVINDNKWHQVGFVYSNNTLKLYIDGQVVKSKTTSFNGAGNFNTTNPICIASHDHLTAGNCTGYFTDGFFDEIKFYNFALTNAQVLSNYNARSNPDGASLQTGNTQNLPGALTNGLVGYWKMDDNVSGDSKSITDSSGNGKILTTHYGAITTGMDCTVAGKFGGGCSFDGVDDYVHRSYEGSHLNTIQYTLSFWMNAVNASSSSVNASVIQKVDGASDANYGFHWSSSGGTFQKSCLQTPTFLDPGGTKGAQITATMNTGTWYLVTCTFDGTNLKAYLNGQLQSTTPIPNATFQDGEIIIGGGNFNYFEGQVDELRVYNRALSAAEITQLYNYAPGPVAQYDFEEGLNIAFDSSGIGSTSSIYTGSVTSTLGRFGKGVNLNNGTDGIRIPESASTDFNSIKTSMTIEAWVKTNVSVFGHDAYIVSKGTGIVLPFNLRLINISCNPSFLISSSTGAGGQATYSSSICDGKWHHLAGVRSILEDTIYIYVDGIFRNSTNDTSGAGTPDNDFDVSIGNGGASYTGQGFPGQIDGVKIYNYARTPGQIVQDMNAGHPPPGSPVGSATGYWKFDEGYGTTANNSGNCGSSCNGTLSTFASPATSDSGWSQSGKFGKALQFDGSSDVVTVNKDFNFDDADQMTISTWVYFDHTVGWMTLVGQDTTDWASSNAAFYLQKIGGTSCGRTLNAFAFAIGFGSGGCDLAFAQSTTIPTANTWYHVVGTYDGSTIKIYINGNLEASTSFTTGIPTQTGNFVIGEGYFNDALADTLDGRMDEVKVYNQALTADQVKLDMNGGQAQQFGNAGNKSSYENNAANQEYCVPGDTTSCAAPIARWRFEEGSGSTVNDISGNSYSGTFEGTSNHWTSGKFGKAGYFNITNSDDVNLGATTLGSPTSVTLEAWVRLDQTPTGNGNDIINIGNTFILRGSDSAECGSPYASGIFHEAGGWHAICTSSLLSGGTWYHLAYTFDGPGHSQKLYLNGTLVAYDTRAEAVNYATNFSFLGNNPSCCWYLTGKIDDARVYNYARTPAQVAWDYNQGKPLAWYKMDECQGTTINDSSGNSLTGTLSLTPAGTTAAGNCVTSATSAWYNGRTGKFNYSLAFDGNDDYVETASSTKLDSTYGTWAGWFKASTQARIGILTRGDSSNSTNGVQVFIDDNHKLGMSLKGAGAGGVLSITSTNTVDDSQWHHFAATFNDTGTAYLYLDGILVASGTPSGSWSFNSQVLRLGKATDTFWGAFTGQLDDIKIFNYPLTATQVKTLYNNGAVNFSPTTGAP